MFIKNKADLDDVAKTRVVILIACFQIFWVFLSHCYCEVLWLDWFLIDLDNFLNFVLVSVCNFRALKTLTCE